MYNLYNYNIIYDFLKKGRKICTPPFKAVYFSVTKKPNVIYISKMVTSLVANIYHCKNKD